MTPPTSPPSGGPSRREGGPTPPIWTWRPSWLPAGRARWFLFLLLLVVGFLGYDWIRLSAIGSNRYAGKGWKFPTRVYADWREWKIGDRHPLI